MMDRNVLKASYIILMSLGLALVFNYLFFEKFLGISVVILVSVLLSTVFLFGLYQKLSLRKSWWLVLFILFFALMPSIRANEFLIFLNLCAVFGLLMLLAHQLVGTPAFLMRFIDYFMLMVIVPFIMLGKAISSIALLGQIHSNTKNRDMWLRVLKGIIMAIPVLILFGVLFSKADLAFSQFIENFIDIDISERTIQYTVLLAFSFVASLCYLSYIFFSNKTDSPLLRNQSPAMEKKNGRGIEVLVFLGLISALFLMFIGFQITYLFGGETNIVNAGFTYSEYARRGFWELLAVAIVSLLVLLASEKYSGSESKRDKQFIIPALILTAEVAIVIISALKRLALYIDAYGMTLLRFYVAGFIMLLMALFILLAIKFIRSKQEHFFAFSALVSIASLLIAINIVNPDAFTIKYNLRKYAETDKIDLSYLRDLSADAMPWKIDLYNRLEGEDKEFLRNLLQEDRERLQNLTEDWQSTNLSHSRALRLLQDF